MGFRIADKGLLECDELVAIILSTGFPILLLAVRHFSQQNPNLHSLLHKAVEGFWLKRPGGIQGSWH